MASLRVALGGSASHSTREPVSLGRGGRGTLSLARPTRQAHALAATAMLKASSAVYSCSSEDGYTQEFVCWLQCGFH